MRTYTTAGIKYLALGLSFLCVATASAQSSFSLNQDTPTGHYSEWIGHGIRTSGTLIATVNFKEVRGDSRWSPFASFHIEGSNGLDGEFARAMFSFHANPTGALMLLDREGKQKRSIAFPNNFTVKTPFDVSIRWSNRSVEVRIDGGSPHQIELPFVPTQLRILSGSGNVDFLNVRVQ